MSKRKKMSPFKELQVKSRLASADKHVPSGRITQAPDFASTLTDYRVMSREIAYELHRAALAGKDVVEVIFPAGTPAFAREGYVEKACSLLADAGFPVPSSIVLDGIGVYRFRG